MQLDSAIILENNLLVVELYADRPIIKGYRYKPNDEKMTGAGKDGVLVINNMPTPWNQFDIKIEKSMSGANYNISLPKCNLSFDMNFTLKDNILAIELKNIQDPKKYLKTISWKNLPILVCDNTEYNFWRLSTGEPDSTSGGKMWMRELGGQIKSSEIENTPFPVIYGSIYHPDKLCVFVHSSYPLFPLTHQITPEKHYAISLNTYQYRVRDQIMPPLKAQVVFLKDENGDGKSDLSDYCLWLNHQIPDGDSIYHNSIWYKIFLDLPATGVRTTFSQAQEIIEAIYNVTDGLPQIVYLVGWQYEGHDTGYPAMDKVNEHIGGREALLQLVKASKELFNTIISYHNNIDDAYPEYEAWDNTIIGDCGNISHCLDAESGKIYKRLTDMMETVPVEKTIHFDNARITSGVASKNIGIMEELECGLRPIIEFMRRHGITVTTEGQNGIPIDCSPIFQGLWHYDPPMTTAQIWHRKIMGGGWGDHTGPQSRFELGLGSSIHQDFSYLPIDRESLGDEIWDKYFHWFDRPSGLTLSFVKDWDEIVDRIYRGTLLYHFYLEHEMTNFQRVPDGVRIEYDNKEIVVENANNHLRVTWGDVIIADDDDRFIPCGNAIYAYSLAGSECDWILPERFRVKELQVFTLSKNGKGAPPDYKLEKDRIHLKLEPRIPVLLLLASEIS